MYMNIIRTTTRIQLMFLFSNFRSRLARWRSYLIDNLAGDLQVVPPLIGARWAPWFPPLFSFILFLVEMNLSAWSFAREKSVKLIKNCSSLHLGVHHFRYDDEVCLLTPVCYTRFAANQNSFFPACVNETSFLCHCFTRWDRMVGVFCSGSGNMHVKTVTLATIDNPSWSFTPAISQWDKPSEAHTRFADNVKARTIDLAQGKWPYGVPRY